MSLVFKCLHVFKCQQVTKCHLLFKHHLLFKYPLFLKYPLVSKCPLVFKRPLAFKCPLVFKHDASILSVTSSLSIEVMSAALCSQPGATSSISRHACLKNTNRLLMIFTTVWPSWIHSENNGKLMNVSCVKDITNSQQNLLLIAKH